MRDIWDFFFWKHGLAKRIIHNIGLPDGWYVRELSMFTAMRLPGGKMARIYTYVEYESSSVWTNGHILYDIKSGRKLTKLVAEDYYFKKFRREKK